MASYVYKGFRKNGVKKPTQWKVVNMQTGNVLTRSKHRQKVATIANKLTVETGVLHVVA